MLTDSQQITWLFKRALGLSNTNNRPFREFYNEPYPSKTRVLPSQIWSQESLIPAIAPILSPGDISGVVQYHREQLQAITGTLISFYHPALVNAIPYNHDPNGSYVYRLYESDNATLIPFGKGSWLVDNSTGVLTFYDVLPADIASGNRPYLSWYRYIGSTGISSDVPTFDGTIIKTGHPVSNSAFSRYAFEDNTFFGKDLKGVNNGVSYGTITRESPGIINDSANFGIDGYVIVGNSPDFNITVDFAVTFWIKLKTTGVNRTVIYTGLPADSLYNIYINNTENIYIEMREPPSTINTYTSLTTLTINEWHHVVFQRRNTYYELYIDSVYDSGIYPPLSSSVITTTSDILIGTDSVDYLNSYLDELRFYQVYIPYIDIRYMYEIYNSEATELSHRDSLALSIKKIDDVIAKLAPDPPDNINDVLFTITDSYTARMADSVAGANPVPNRVTNGIIPSTDITPSFRKYPTEYLRLSTVPDVSGDVDILMTYKNDSTVGTNYTIIDETDYDNNIWQTMKINYQLPVGVYPGSNTTLYTFNYSHPDTLAGSIGFYIDNSGTARSAIPVINTPSISSLPVHDGSTYVSGIPALTNTQQIQITFTPVNCVREFFNDTQIATVEEALGAVDSVTITEPSSYVPNTDVPLVVNCDISPDAYTENVSFNITIYTSNNETDTYTGLVHSVYSNVRIDTVSSNESTFRVYSGIGSYPTYGGTPSIGEFGAVFVPSGSLAGVNNYELQLLNGEYRVPLAVDYSSGYYPVGPDYSALTYDPVGGFRYLTTYFTITDAYNITINITATGLTSVIEPSSDFYLHVRVMNGSTSVTGWLDANKVFTGTGSPSIDGDGVLVYSLSTITSKFITFGETSRSGTLYVRLGLSNTSTVRISNIVIS